MSWHLLQRFIDSDVFNSNPFLPVSYLERYADHVGIQYVLCSKLRQFPYDDIEFFLPQLCHLVITVKNESMALEEFLLDLCEESVIAALLTFWMLQTYLRDLSSNPQAEAFQTCRRVYNKVQHIVFGLSDAVRNEKINDNVLPVTVLGSFVLASIGMPLLSRWASPLAVSQARKPQPLGDITPQTNHHPQPQPTGTRPARAHTVTSGSTKSRRAKDGGRMTNTTETPKKRREKERKKGPAFLMSPEGTDSRPTSSGSASRTPTAERAPIPAHLEIKALEASLSSTSLPLPEVRTPITSVPRPATPVSAGIHSIAPEGVVRRHSHHVKTLLKQGEMTLAEKKKLLMQNYFRSETQFLTALEDISNRLVIVPKQARLSALRAELALIAQDLPAEVDIPVICPPNLVDGSPGKSRHHRIVRLNPAESTVLNSAEKVPYLLMVEILRDDFTFDPESPDNQRLLANLMAERGQKKRIFDLSESPTLLSGGRSDPEPPVDSVFEPTSGDLGSSPLMKPAELSSNKFQSKNAHNLPRLSSGATTVSTFSDNATPRSSGAGTSRSSSPNRKTSQPTPRIEPQDFSALATHMRMASQMLAQLDATSGKRPKHEVAAIRTKIIASMQTLEEQSFDLDDGSGQGPTFDLIMAKASTTASTGNTIVNGRSADIDVDASIESSTVNTGAGLARMENDFITGGVQRKGDRDDPSAAVFGEAWHSKKERIRRSSPYGWMKNWDLVSVIVKTGSDLRQEAFACQLIKVCHKIWVDAGVNVWVKLMMILVTGESSGLIETITNGVSLHSLKRSLTMSSIDSGQNPRGRIATLKDHFVKAFGPEDTESHKAAVDAFKRSLAAYSAISYVLQLKDRHNGNVLIDNEGHIIHIDFGFMLSNSPGSVGFEAAPFKLTHEYVEVLGGVGSGEWEEYKTLCKQAFQGKLLATGGSLNQLAKEKGTTLLTHKGVGGNVALRRSADKIVDLVSMMGRDSKMPCYAAGVATTTSSLRQRFQLHLSADEAEQFVETDLIAKSYGSYYTRLYDTFQYRTQGIY